MFFIAQCDTIYAQAFSIHTSHLEPSNLATIEHSYGMKKQHYVSGPAQLVTAIPHILGFHPEASLVIAVLNDDYVETIQRLDWPVDAIDLNFDVKFCVGSDVVIILYTEDFKVSQADVDTITDLTSDAFSKHHHVLDQLVVVGSRWRSLMCDDESCCPVDGRESLVDGLPVEVEYIVRGSAPFASREAMEQSLAPRELTQPEVSDRDAALIVALDAIKAGTKESSNSDSASATDYRLQMVESLHLRLMNGSQMDWADGANLIAGLHDIHIRDCLLKRLLDDEELRSQVKVHLLSLIPTASESSVVVLATALAGCVWLDGNGALAAVALERALECDPSYSLAVLLNRAINFGVPPSVWSDSLLAVSQEECLQGAA